MRWSIIRIIWFRDLRDQLRDRRTVLMMVALPLLLYPALGFGVLQFALGILKRPSIVGIVGAEYLPGATVAGQNVRPAAAWLAATPRADGISGFAGALALASAAQQSPARLPAGANALPVVAWLTATPTPGGPTFPVGAAALATVWQQGLGQDYPPLLLIQEGRARFAPSLLDAAEDIKPPQVRLLDHDGAAAVVDRAPLDSKQVDLLIVVPPDFRARLETDGRPMLHVLSREGDDHSRVVSNRVYLYLAKWKKQLKEVRLRRRGLPADFDDVFEVRDPERTKPLHQRATEDLFDILLRIFPFILVMWSLAGALYPAVDLCAGEKERGTMETLLISPAGREEIVLGKFLTIWVFSAATALLNLLSLTGTTWLFSGILPRSILSPGPLAWCVVLLLPLSAFFSALCLAVGAYARSSKEGQYYLMPLFVLTMPLIFLTLAPGVELSPFWSLVPVTGIALLMQKLMAASSLEQVPWFYFLPVLAPMVLYGWLALRWAIEQFKREEVLFREAERLDLGLWLRHLFRDKEALPSAGQAAFCFALILFLHWLAFGLGGRLSPLTRTAVGYLGLVLAPTLFVALLLTTRPREALGLSWASGRYLAAGALLAVLLLPPVAELTVCIVRQFPGLMELLKEHHPLTGAIEPVAEGGSAAAARQAREAWWQYLLVLAVLPAVCEELAFRGLILAGLQRRFRPWTAVLLSSLLFALYHMNVFQLLPAFAFGVVLGLLAVRSGSVLPGMLLHLLHNGLLVGLTLLQSLGFAGEVPGMEWLRPAAAGGCTLVAAAVLWRLARTATPRIDLDPGVAAAGCNF